MTTTRTAGPRPPLPQTPAHLHTQLSILSAADRALDHGQLPGTALLEALCLSLIKTPEQIEAEREYDRQVEAYNAWVKAYNAPILAERQARRNAAEARRVRAAACTTCFCVHAGECA